MKINSYSYLKHLYPRYVILILAGWFYDAYENSAHILNECFGYKVYETMHGQERAGFPKYVLDKVLNTLERYKINYLVVENYEIVIKNSFENNNYTTYNTTKSSPRFRPAPPRIICNTIVKIGDTVSFMYEDSGEIVELEIIPLNRKVKYRNFGGAYYGASTEFVADLKEDFADDQIADDSPIARALLGHEVGEIVEVKLPNNKSQKIKIININ